MSYIVSMVSSYQDAQQAGRQALRAAILESAITLLLSEGVAALTMRRVAAEVGASTKVLYTMCGGKEGLIDALYREGFARLQRVQESVPHDLAPLERMRVLSVVYREHALAEPSYYRVMFEHSVPGFEPSPESRTAADAAFGTVVDAVAACIDAGVFAPADPYEIAKVCWAASHGAVSLELAGHFPHDKGAERYSTLMIAVARYFTAPTGTTNL